MPRDTARAPWKRIGQMLVRRRTELDPARYRTRRGWMDAVTAAGLSKRVIVDIETGARDNYRDETLGTVEDLYRLKRGTIRQAIAGGPLLTEDGTPLHGPGDRQEAETPRYAAELHSDPVTGRISEIAREIGAELDGVPAEEAEAMLQRVMASIEVQAAIAVQAERRRWERERERGWEDS